MTPLLRHPADVRSVTLVVVYMGLLAALLFVPATRNVVVYAAACAGSFLNTVVIHNHQHQGLFRSRLLNRAWSCVVSFGALYPASANLPSHNVVHHAFADGDAPDWAAPGKVNLGHPLLDLLHFPNVAGPDTFAGVRRWAAGRKAFGTQYQVEMAVAFGITGALLVWDFWSTLFFLVMPQLYGARNILRINLLQHAGCDTDSTWNHSRNFVGRAFNYVMCNNGYHTLHHMRPGVHWSNLPALHAQVVAPHIDPRLVEPSLVGYLLRTFLLGGRTRPLAAAAC
ncbi:MAG: fatty acid desaturase [Myxococcota bacterium]